VHEQREISAVVRERLGVSSQAVSKSIQSALNSVPEIERGQNVDGRPTYRDTSVRSPYATAPSGDKPDWMRPLEPVRNCGPHRHGSLGAAEG
jgi:hypothetical protein